MQHNFDKLNLIIIELEGFQTQLIQFQKEFNNKDYKTQDFLLTLMLQRYRDNYSAILILLKEFHTSNDYLEPPIGIILRSLIYDSMVILFAIAPELEKDDSDYDKSLIFERLNKYISDQIYKIMTDGNKAVHDGFITSIQRDLMFNNLIKKTPFLFTKMDWVKEDYSNFRKLFKYKGRIDFEREFRLLPEGKVKNLCMNIYDVYSFYSKYFHFGIYTYDLRQDKNELFKYLFRSLSYTVNACYELTKIAKSNLTTVPKSYNEMLKYLYSIVKLGLK